MSNQKISIIFLFTCGIFWVNGFIYSNERKISPIEANYGRYYVQIIISITIILFRRESFLLENENDYKILIIRSTISGINGILMAFL